MHRMPRVDPEPRRAAASGSLRSHDWGYHRFPYSDALKKANIVWNDQSLEKWLTDPDAFLPGNNMNFLCEAPRTRGPDRILQEERWQVNSVRLKTAAHAHVSRNWPRGIPTSQRLMQYVAWGEGAHGSSAGLHCISTKATTVRMRSRQVSYNSKQKTAPSQGGGEE